VNNANIAVQNVPNPQGTLTPLDASNNWWGMPTGTTHDGIPAGDAVGQNVVFAPHLPAMPFPCDLASADWTPFSEQELQFAINQNLPTLRGIGFALLDMEWGYGAKFSLVSKPDYGGLAGEAYIRITPSPDGAFVTLTIDMSRLPTDLTLSQIATCELMPLFLNSIGQVQHKLAPTVADIDHIVPMASDLMVRFAPNAPEITPEPAPTLVMNYDTSCLPPTIPILTPTPPPQNEGESELLIQIPPIEGEFTLPETGTQQTPPIFLTVDTTADNGTLNQCTDAEGDCSLRGALEYVNNNRAQNNLSHHVIILPNNTYGLTTELQVIGNITIVGADAYTNNTSIAGAVIVRTSSEKRPLFSISPINGNTPSKVTIYNLTFKDNTTFVGGGIEIQSSDVTIYNSQFINNFADWGGAISVDTQSIPTPRSTVHIVNSLFQHNESRWMGGAIIGHTGGSVTLVECSSFENNHSYYAGGAISASSYTEFTGLIDVKQSNFIHNTVTVVSNPSEQNAGGAVYRTATSSAVSVAGNYWSPDNPPSTNATDDNSIWGVNALPVSTTAFSRECDVPLPPNETTQCSNPNEVGRLSAINNLNREDRLACLLLYKDIIYLTIYHEFSLDQQLVFSPYELADFSVNGVRNDLVVKDDVGNILFEFNILDYEYNGQIDSVHSPDTFVLGTSRSILEEEIELFRTYESNYSPYYLFARAIANRMFDEDYLVSEFGPMTYFKENYLTTITDWIGKSPFCDGKTEVDDGTGKIICLNRDWFALANEYRKDNSSFPNAKIGYYLIMPYVEQALYDAVYGVSNEKGWVSAIFSVVPTNILLPKITYLDPNQTRILRSYQSCFNTPLDSDSNNEPYVFQSFLGWLWKLTWADFEANQISCPGHPNVFYSASIWDEDNNRFTYLQDMENSCTNVNETLAESYMRHLRENYDTNDFEILKTGADIDGVPNSDTFTLKMVRFGMNQRSMHMPLLGVRINYDASSPELRQLIWYIYRFNIVSGLDGNDISPSTLGSVTRPITEQEFIPYLNNSVIQPLECIP